jgi:hypothetical protein
MRQRRPRHERPGFINDGSALAAVNTASRRLWRWPAASVDRHCARRFWEGRPGRRNAVQPNKETLRSQMRHERRNTPRFSGRITPAFPKQRPCRDDGLGQAAMLAGGAWTETPGNPAYLRLDRPFPLQTPSGGSPALTPYRSMTPAWMTALRRKGIDFQGPVTEASIHLFERRSTRLRTH